MMLFLSAGKVYQFRESHGAPFLQFPTIPTTLPRNRILSLRETSELKHFS